MAVSWAQMLHYCLTGAKITAKEVGGYLCKAPAKQPRTHLTVDPFDKQTGNWEFEQELLEKIRKGDLSVMDTIARANAHTPKAMPQETIEDYRQMEHLLLTLVSRAAVDGGMPQKSAFSLCTEYREKLNLCETHGEMAVLTNQMLEDYAQRVHRAQQLATCSARNQEIDDMFLSLYNDKAKGILTEQRFMKLTSALEQEQESNKQRLHDLVELMRQSDEQECDVRAFISEIRQYATIQELDEVVLHRLISRILVGEVKKVDGQKIQEVKIVYNFVGEIPETL